MHSDLAGIERRVRRALDRRIGPAIHGARAELSVTAWRAPGPVGFEQAARAAYEPFAVGDRWGAPWSTTWFALRGEVPEAWAKRSVEARIDLGWPPGPPGFSCEGLVHDGGGRELKGLSAANPWVTIPAGSSSVELWVEAVAIPRIDDVTPLGDPATAGEQPLYRLARCELAVRRPAVARLAGDIELLLELAESLPDGEPRRASILFALERALDRIALREVADGVDAAAAELVEVLAAPATASAQRVSAVGHAHLDTAWLWPLAETRRKVARTLANAVALAESDPDALLAFSQAQQLVWLREDRPQLFERVRDAVAAGSIVLTGGMWVEPDGNLPGGEAMARQLIYGKRFFEEQFGVETEEVWMPDSFGYTAALPQLAALAGNRFMLTQKLSWNDTDRFPHHTLWWEGIDGTRLFTHFPPVDTYTAEMRPAELRRGVARFAESGRATRTLVPFGHGDGGGGPTREMLAAIRRSADLEGLPRVSIETPEAFFTQALAEYPDAPVWSGELYLELHRGTFTTQARVKAANRRCEHLLHEAELWAATAAVRAGAEYPAAALERLWKDVLLLQFHDILPGSSIAWVYREAEALYGAVIGELEALIASALGLLAGEGTAATSFNAAPHPRDGLPALGGGVARARGDDVAVHGPDCDGAIVLENGLVRVRIDGRGLVSSLLDLESGRESLAPGAVGNLLVLHPDTPNDWEAWDVDRFYRNVHVDLVEAESVELVAADRARAVVRVRRRFGDSSVQQLLSVSRGERCLQVDAEIDWHEHERLLKVAWPFDVHAGVATSEIQFGHLQRPTHANTSWDAARFETWAHRYLHVGEPQWGVAVTTTATYGHDVTRTTRDGGGTTTTVRLSLLRGPRYPDPGADQGHHALGWRVHPGASVADAVGEGYRTNLPVRTVSGAGREVAALVGIEGAAAVIETVKLADDGSGDVIVRLYEPLGNRDAGTLRLGFAAASATEVDLLERPPAPEAATGALSPLSGDAVPLALRPFQILTVRVARA